MKKYHFKLSPVQIEGIKILFIYYELDKVINFYLDLILGTKTKQVDQFLFNYWVESLRYISVYYM